MLNILFNKLVDVFDDETLKTLKTKKGCTQKSEEIYKSYIKNILEKIDCKYTEASSQKSIDFILEDNIKLEVKKTDSLKIMLNDTYPEPDVYYLILYTGTKTKKGKVILKSGDELIDEETRNKCKQLKKN